jgi:hypothetical protein
VSGGEGDGTEGLGVVAGGNELGDKGGTSLFDTLNQPVAWLPSVGNLVDVESLINNSSLPEIVKVVAVTLVSQISSPVPFVLLLPLGILGLIFTYPRILVLGSKKLKPVKKALIMVLSEGRFIKAHLTNERGYAPAFKLKAGEYRIVVSALGFSFPALVEGRVKGIYRGEYFRVTSESTFRVAPLILLGSLEKTVSTQVVAEDLLGQKVIKHKLINLCINLWAVGAVLAVLMTMIYASYLNLIVIALYLAGLINRLIKDKTKVNVTGVIRDLNGNPVKQAMIEVALNPYGQVVGGSVSDKMGRFSLYLNPEEEYSLKLKGLSLISGKTKRSAMAIDFKASDELELSLVAEE